MIIIIDGPEKVGKSTLVAQIVKSLGDKDIRARVRKWGQIFPDDRVYLEPLQQDAADIDTVSIWDRSWASEYVYGKLLKRDRRLASDPWLGEWLYGRAVASCGTRVMMTASPHQLAERRDDTDLPVDPAEEMGAFLYYANLYGWETLTTHYSLSHLKTVAEYIIDTVVYSGRPPSFPPIYAGPKSPDVVFVGEVRSQNPQMVGAWLPFTSRYTTEFARPLGHQAMRCGWTNCHEIAPQRLRQVPVIVSCGKTATSWVKNYVITVKSKTVHISLPHPSWTYRYNNESTKNYRAITTEVLGVIKQWMEGRQDLDFLVKHAVHHRIISQ